MKRNVLLLALLLCLACTCTSFAAKPVKTTVVVDGKVVAVPMIESNGKAFVDVAALMKLLGGKSTYYAASHKVAISSPAPKAAAVQPTGGGGGASSGTAQLAGDNGELTKVYSLSKRGPLYFALQSAEFTTDQVVIGDQSFVPAAAEKLLVLKFSVQNPQKAEQYIRWDALRMTAVDAMNVNHPAEGNWGDVRNHGAVGLSLMPAQKLDMYTVIRVPARGPIPKLMVQPSQDDDGPILRYDLRDKVTGLKPPFADPADASGATALEQVAAVVGTAYPLARLDVTVEGFQFSNATLGGNELAEGSRYLLATVLLKNEDPNELYIRWDALTPKLTSADGAELTYTGMLAGAVDHDFAQSLGAGQSVRVRLYFEVPEGFTPGTLTLSEGESRTYLYEVK